ncbi:hypothetical protein ACP275_03G002800 [Erythranthe tilingii]
MEDLGAAQVVSPTVIHQSMVGRFHDSYNPTSKKRGPPFHSSNSVHNKSPSDNWNPKSWNWDSARFVAKPVQCDNGFDVGGGAPQIQIQTGLPARKEVLNGAPIPRKPDRTGGDDENLRLKLGGENRDGVNNNNNNTNNNNNNTVEMQLRPSKRVRSGSPGGANYPVCQVDNCVKDLSAAKDYHRRHKVCEFHSKAGNALVGKQMQRFCQQCSRFHPLSEFDEGKRSCRRRLAGHNRRRRKTQPEDTVNAPQSLVPCARDNTVNDSDIVNLLAVLSRAQGNTEERSGKIPAIPDKDQLIQILSKINSLPSQTNMPSKPNGTIPNNVPSENQNQINGKNNSSTSTKNLLVALSAHTSSQGSDSEKSKSPCVDNNRDTIIVFPTVGGERSSTSYHSPMEEVQETSPCVPLELFSPSPEDYRSMKLPSDGNFLSSGSSNPSVDRTPLSSPPVVYDLFPMRTMKDDCLSNNVGEIAYVKATMSNGCSTSLQLFGSSKLATENGSIQSSPYRAGYASSGSDHSPSSLNSDAQDRTGRIIFKLFDKDPSHLPGSLQTQIYSWLSNSPSEMESYIRPGCIVLSLYLSMPSFTWDQIDENLLNYVKSLVKDVDIDFWGNGRFLVHTDRQMVSHKEGKIRLCKSWRTWNTPELIAVSPLAVVGGQETALLLRGRSLTAPGTMIHCTHATGYNINEVPLSQDTPFDEVTLACFKANGTLGRCFIEVENNFKGTSFPVIIANNTICQELRLLEPEINGTAGVSDGIYREKALGFLDELGWLFQRKQNSFLFGIPDYRINRFKFLLIFSVEHDFCALVKTLLDILLELNLGRKGLLEKESLELLSEIHLLNRAVKRRCLSMVDLLVRYSVIDSSEASGKFFFTPDMAGPGGITPLHLAACTPSSDDMVDALTNDPQKIGLQSWNTALDANGLSPYAYALMTNNHSYNALVARKIADKENGQVSVSIENEIVQSQSEVDKRDKTISTFNQTQKSCSKCALAVRVHNSKKKFSGSKGLLQRPYIHSMLVVAAVCVCVCVFLRGHPYVGCVSPFAWENLGYGAI